MEKQYGAMPGRPKWVIGWAEDDSTAGAHCCTCWDLQFWVQRMFVNSQDALRYGCEGMMAIHWRTAAISPNIMALARAGWDFTEESPGAVGARGSGIMPGISEFWADWGRGMFGGGVGAEVGRVLQQLDATHPAINALIVMIQNGDWRETQIVVADMGLAPRVPLSVTVPVTAIPPVTLAERCLGGVPVQP